MPQWLSIKQAAEYAGVSKPLIRTWMKDGLRFVRPNINFVRIKPEWVDDYLISFEGTNNEISNKIASAIAGMRN